VNESRYEHLPSLIFGRRGGRESHYGAINFLLSTSFHQRVRVDLMMMIVDWRGEGVVLLIVPKHL